VRFIEFMPLDADHSWSADKVLPNEEIRRLDRRGLPARAVGATATAPRGAGASPTGRARSASSPPVRAVLRRLQPHPADRRGHAPHLPVLAQRDRPARADARRRERRELEAIVRDAVWRKELKHRIGDPGFIQPARSMSRIGG
jgi:cyclic pyranopterin phosphate synthase